MGSETHVLTQNQVGVAIVPMQDVKIDAFQLADNGDIVRKKITLRSHAVIRVGIEFVGKIDQVLAMETVKFQAMVPDKVGSDNLVLSDNFELDKYTGVKIGTAMYKDKVVDPLKK